MILSSEQVRLIQAGKKTQMRVRVIEPGEYQPTRLVGSRVEAGGPLQRVPHGPPRDTSGNEPRVGDLVAISHAKVIDGTTTPVRACSFEVLDYHRALLGASIDLVAARAEGHRTSDDYRTWWVRTHDVVWLNKYVKRHRVEHERDPSVEALSEALLARFENRHQFHLVWVITGRHIADAVDRMIAAEPDRIGSAYTTRMELAVKDGGGAMSEFEQRQESERAREHQALRKAGVAEQDLDRLTGLDAQICDLRQLGVSRGLDLRREIRRLQQTRDAIESKIRQQAQRGPKAA